MERGAEPGGGGVVKLPRPRLLLPKDRGDPRASLAAFVLQVLLIAIVVPAFVVPIAFDLLRDDSGRAVTPERISFITSGPRDGEAVRETLRAGGDGRSPSAEPSATPSAPIVAPTEVPTAVFPRTTPAPRDPGGSGPVIGGGGPTRGIQPAFTDPRLWLPPSSVVTAPDAPVTRADSLRVMLAVRATAYLDSIADLPVDRRPGDWTFEKDGKKYGVDPQWIRLGDFSIPTALLAALPLNVQANPLARERGLQLNMMRSEIQFQAARQARDDEFRAAVRALRERKERERKEAEAKKANPIVETARP